MRELKNTETRNDEYLIESDGICDPDEKKIEEHEDSEIKVSQWSSINGAIVAVSNTMDKLERGYYTIHFSQEYGMFFTKEKIELNKLYRLPNTATDLILNDLSDIDWVIVGGESGPKARPMQKEWVLNIQRQCKEQDVPFFFKQWGTFGEDGVKRNKKANGSTIDGQIFQEYPKQMKK